MCKQYQSKMLPDMGEMGFSMLPDMEKLGLGCWIRTGEIHLQGSIYPIMEFHLMILNQSLLLSPLSLPHFCSVVYSDGIDTSILIAY